MVTKLRPLFDRIRFCSVLAKIHMVTKHILNYYIKDMSSVLAKIHMVTKLDKTDFAKRLCSVLAKIHMVTKLI